MEDAVPATVTQMPTRLNIFGQISTTKVPLGDGVSYVEVQKMTGGMRDRYEGQSSRPLKVSREGEAEVKMDASIERRALLDICIVGWDIYVNGDPWPFNDANKRRFLADAPVELIDEVEKAARELNPWLLDEVTVEALDKQIAELTELRDRKLEEEAGKAN